MQSLLCQNIENYLLSHKPIFGRVSVLDRTSFSNRKDDDFYDNMILNLAIIIVYKSTKIYAKKYNLVGDDRTETLSYFFKKVLDQMQSKNLKS